MGVPAPEGPKEETRTAPDEQQEAWSGFKEARIRSFALAATWNSIWEPQRDCGRLQGGGVASGILPNVWRQAMEGIFMKWWEVGSRKMKCLLNEWLNKQVQPKFDSPFKFIFSLIS